MTFLLKLMKHGAKPDAREALRKQSMVNLWVGKETGLELEGFAEREQQHTGHTTTKTGLAREIFVWAFHIYRRAGSLAKLKSVRGFQPSSRYSADLQEQSLTALQAIFEGAPSPVVEEVARTLTKYAGRYGGET